MSESFLNFLTITESGVDDDVVGGQQKRLRNEENQRRQEQSWQEHVAEEGAEIELQEAEMISEGGHVFTGEPFSMCT